MIGKLKGIVDSIYDEYLILDVNGVGYRVFCSSKILSNIEVGSALSLTIQTIVREDAIMLFGFLWIKLTIFLVLHKNKKNILKCKIEWQYLFYILGYSFLILNYLIILIRNFIKIT